MKSQQGKWLTVATNSWASLVNPLDPSASAGLTQFAAGVVANGDPGVDTAGVDILMESQGLGIAAGNPIGNLIPLKNDDYGTRQFLYPTAVPEPSTIAMLSVLAVAVPLIRQGKKRCLFRSGQGTL